MLSLWIRLSVGLVALVVIGAGCSGDSTEQAVTTPVVTSIAASTIAETTTSTPTLPPTTAVPSTSPSTTPMSMLPTAAPAAPSTSVGSTGPSVDLLTEDAVRAAVLEIDGAFVACALELPDCDGSEMDKWFTGGQLTQAAGVLSQLSNAGYTVQGTEPRTLVVRSVELQQPSGQGEAAQAATIECLFDQTKILDGAGNDVSSSSGSAVYERVYIIEDGRWKRTSQETIEESGGNQCVE